ncbi:MAG: nucleotide-binding protein [Verrucomicrobia bacterium]|nr:nucleotide-binding protein [Verrucomicrobiota bacterium]
MNRKTVFIVEDDDYLARSMSEEVSELGCKCVVFGDCKRILFHRGVPPDFVIADLFVPLGSDGPVVRGLAQTRYAGKGVSLLREARRKWPKSRLILMTGLPSEDAHEWCKQNQVAYVLKPIGRDAIERMLQLRRLRAFVVHGRNTKARAKAVAALKAAGIDPVVLMKQSNRGQTVIEKFERIADSCDCAVVVWSPDDFGGLARAPRSNESRVRQNVLFELGYFYGALRRRSGRVVVLESGETEIPSDLAGIARLDATKPLDDIAAELRNELRHLIA